MSYKGGDLELRTLQNWSGVGRETAHDPSDSGVWTRTTIYNGGRADPLLVDDVLLSCINHAYDLAVAHRAGEVRIEHLLNALTLNKTAARILEDHGVAVAALRRESAGIVATVIPVGLGNGKIAPNTSEELEQVLRLAADRAYPRRDPITVDIILEVLREMKQEISGLDLLRRHVTTKSSTGDASQNVTDTVQNSRLDALEKLVRNLTQELAEERQAYSALAADQNRGGGGLRRHTISARASADDDSLALIAERLEQVENGIENRFSDLAKGWVEMADHLQRLDTKLDEQPVSLNGSVDVGPAVEAKLSKFENTFSVVLERLAGLERKLDDQGVAMGTDLTPLTSRLSGIEERSSQAVSGTRALFERIESIENKIGVLAERPARVDSTAVESRLHAVSSAVNDQSERFEAIVGQQFAPIRQSLADFEQRATQLTAGHDENLDEVHNALLKLNANQQTLSGAIDQWRQDQTGNLQGLSNRVETVEAESHSIKGMVETMASNIGVVYAILSRREANKSKFKNWLFGTDDWYSASWDTQRWREQMIAAGSFVPMPRRGERSRPSIR